MRSGDGVDEQRPLVDGQVGEEIAHRAAGRVVGAHLQQEIAAAPTRQHGQPNPIDNTIRASSRRAR